MKPSIVVVTLVLAGLALLAVLTGAPSPVAEVASLALLWFLPGFAVQAALLAGQHSVLPLIDRFGLSAGLSLALTAICGVLLDLGHLPVTGHALAGAAAGVTLLACVLGLFRRNHASPPRPSIPLRSIFRPSAYHVTGLAILIAVGGGLAALAWKDAPSSDEFTEIGILQVDGDVPSLPLRVSPGQAHRFSIVITNHEGEPTDYSLRFDSGRGASLPPPQALTLSDGQSVAVPVELAWTGPGRTRLLVELDRGDSQTYRQLSLPVVVGE